MGIGSRADLNPSPGMLAEPVVSDIWSVVGGDTPDVKRVPDRPARATTRSRTALPLRTGLQRRELEPCRRRAPLTQPGVNVARRRVPVRGGRAQRSLRRTTSTASSRARPASRSMITRRRRIRTGTGARDGDGRAGRRTRDAACATWRGSRTIGGRSTEMTGGRVAYVYLPDTGVRRASPTSRATSSRRSTSRRLIVDERFNGGGALRPTDIIEFLSPQAAVLAVRRATAATTSTPQGAIFGPKVMLINEFAGSGGDAHALVLPSRGRRQARSANGRGADWSAARARRRSMDGGFVTAPSSARVDPGAEPVDRRERRASAPTSRSSTIRSRAPELHDPQLERAVQEILTELERIRRRNWCGRSFRHTAPSNSKWRGGGDCQSPNSLIHQLANDYALARSVLLLSPLEGTSIHARSAVSSQRSATSPRRGGASLSVDSAEEARPVRRADPPRACYVGRGRPRRCSLKAIPQRPSMTTAFPFVFFR